MIIVDNSDDNASTTRTLTPSASKIPPHFIKLVALSIPLSLISLITCLLDLAVSRPVRAVPTILAFCASFPYHTAVVLLVWLHAHQITSILPFAPTSPRGVTYAAALFLLWVTASGFNVQRAVEALHASAIFCLHGIAEGHRVVPVPCGIYHPRGAVEVNPVFAAVTACVEVLVFGAIVILCYLRRRRPTTALPQIEPSMVESETKVISA